VGKAARWVHQAIRLRHECPLPASLPTTPGRRQRLSQLPLTPRPPARPDQRVRHLCPSTLSWRLTFSGCSMSPNAPSGRRRAASISALPPSAVGAPGLSSTSWWWFEYMSVRLGWRHTRSRRAGRIRGQGRGLSLVLTYTEYQRRPGLCLKVQISGDRQTVVPHLWEEQPPPSPLLFSLPTTYLRDTGEASRGGRCILTVVPYQRRFTG